MEIGRFYTVQEASEILGVQQEIVLHWIHHSELAAMNVSRKINGKRPSWRIAESELGKFLLGRRTAEKWQASATPAKRPSPKKFI